MTHRQHGRQSPPTTLDELAGHVPQTHIDGAKMASEAFRQAGIAHVLVGELAVGICGYPRPTKDINFLVADNAHVLVGGLAVGICGYPRPTKDINFLVADNAFEYHGFIVTHKPGLPISYKGVGIDWVSLEPHERGALEEFLVLPSEGEVPTIPVEPLIAMKLLAGRHKDQTDIVEMIKAGADVEATVNFVARSFPHKTELLNKLILIAEQEE